MAIIVALDRAFVARNQIHDGSTTTEQLRLILEIIAWKSGLGSLEVTSKIFRGDKTVEICLSGDREHEERALHSLPEALKKWGFEDGIRLADQSSSSRIESR